MMSNIIYDFLTESFLFRDTDLKDNYEEYSDDTLLKELESYRSYILRNLERILNNINDSNKNLTVFSEMYGSQPVKIDLLKQCSLYVHKFVLNDPLFKFTDTLEKEDPATNAVTQYLGLNKKFELDRDELRKIINYLKQLTPAVVTGYVKIIPGSFIHESPKEIPLMYSPNYFSDIRQKAILEYFHDNVVISPMEKHEGGFIVHSGEALKPCRAIHIDLKNHSEFYGRFFVLLETKIHSFDEQTRQVTFYQTLPDEPPAEDYFNKWVFQSINQTANGFCSTIENEISLASKFNSTYLTQSLFVDNLLRINFDPSEKVRDKVTTNTLNTLLKMNLPIIEDASLNDVVSVRLQDGELFENFRSDLEKKLNDVRTIKNDEELATKLENISHELNEIHINSIERQTKILRNKFFRNSAIIFASLVGAVATSGFSLLGAAIAAGQGYNSYQDYKNEIKKNPAYLLWKINKNTRK